MRKVSIITPIYNGEKFINQYIDAILRQDYPNIELIIVNDGSTDGTDAMIEARRQDIEKKVNSFLYIVKENGGQPSAINTGLKVFTGEYLTWPDCDDVMHDDYISKKVQYLEQNEDCDFLITRSAVIDAKTGETIRHTWENEPKTREELLWRILNNVQYDYEPGNFFVKKTAVDKYIINRHIYDECGRWSGPQVQIMLPIIYSGKYIYKEDVLFDYYLHENNDHSRMKTKEQLIVKHIEMEKLFYYVIEQLPADSSEIEEMKKIAHLRVKRSEADVAFQFNDRTWFEESYAQLKGQHYPYKKHLQVKNVLIHIKMLNRLYRKYIAKESM